jgi:hypothetical protein
MSYKKWETWAAWDDCGSNWCTHPDCAYHRNQEQEDCENFDSEVFFNKFPRFREPSAREKDDAMIDSIKDIAIGNFDEF